MKLIFLLVLLIGCAGQKDTGLPKYDRKSWNHWTDSDKNCLNTRQEILRQRSKIPVTLSKKKCTVKKGNWDDYYYPETHTLASKVDIDHLIPLKHAHEQGGARWSAKEKEVFANDPENLVITNKKYNRTKGAKGISEWLPVHKEYACKYMRDYRRVKMKYKLDLTQREKKAIVDSKCDLGL